MANLLLFFDNENMIYDVSFMLILHMHLMQSSETVLDEISNSILSP